MRIQLAAVLVVAGSPAWAQDRPAITPSRDVAVTYRVTTDGEAPSEIRTAWLAARSLMRMDLPDGQGWMILDKTSGRAFMVTEAQRRILDMPGNSLPIGVAPDASARFTREGRARVANTDCVNWRMEGQAQVARICLTGDGVMLRRESLEGQRAGRLEAITVLFAGIMQFDL